MRKQLLVALVAFAAVSLSPAGASAQTYVGSWQVNDGPNWTTQPTAYSGLAAAALLFGGSPNDYFISTIDANALNINFMSWYSTYGISAGQQYAQNYSNTSVYNQFGHVSAYIDDNAIGSQYTNYAFRTDVVATPEPASMVLLATGLAGVFGVVRRRRR